MFKGGDNRTSNSFHELNQYIEGRDVFNSYMVRKLNDPSLVKTSYVITRYEYRPDLIAKDIYGSADYCGLLMSQCRISLSSYKRGTVLKVISKEDLNKIVTST